MELRERAIRNWRYACELIGWAEEVVAASRAIGERTARLQDEARDRLARRGVDRVVDAYLRDPGAGRPWGPLGIIAAGSPGRLDDLEKTLQGEMASVDRALDGATAVGLAIVRQPDLSLLDDDLDIVSGAEAALAIRRYAPSSKVILLTADPELAHTAASHGIRTLGKSTSSAYLRRVISSNIA